MDGRNPLAWLVGIALLIILVGAAACAAPATPSPSPSPFQPTSTPTPTPTATSEPPADRRIALYAAGSDDQSTLHALAADGTTTDLAEDVFSQAAVSPDGRWIATPNSQLPANGVIVSSLEASTTYTIPVTPDFDPYSMAFDPDVTRLVFLELGPHGEDGSAWALTVVGLEDGSTTRFHATTGPDNTLLPGLLIGWLGDELLLDTFIPGTEAGSQGVWAVSLPPETESAPVDTLDRRQLLAQGAYLHTPAISAETARLLYLNRDYDYTPDNYGPVGFDVAVNQLGLLDLESGSTELLVEETAGGALGLDVAWSPDGTMGLFAKGAYSKSTFISLTLKMVDPTGVVTDVAPLPLPPEGTMLSLDWCVQDVALSVMVTGDGVYQLHAVDLTNGEWSLLTSADRLAILDCVSSDGSTAANADVTYVRAVESGEGTWTFHVTVEHPDTGWEDYADGWDVVTPEGEVLKPDPESAFTRTLLHPHVDEQPFTRSQSGIVIPEGVTRVRVRAHDIVDGFGGQEVWVDLTESSGPNFEVEQE